MVILRKQIMIRFLKIIFWSTIFSGLYFRKTYRFLKHKKNRKFWPLTLNNFLAHMGSMGNFGFLFYLCTHGLHKYLALSGFLLFEMSILIARSIATHSCYFNFSKQIFSLSRGTFSPALNEFRKSIICIFWIYAFLFKATPKCQILF